MADEMVGEQISSTVSQLPLLHESIDIAIGEALSSEGTAIDRIRLVSLYLRLLAKSRLPAGAAHGIVSKYDERVLLLLRNAGAGTWQLQEEIAAIFDNLRQRQ